MPTIRNKNIISWLAVGVWMGLIFYLSHQPADQSSNLSSGIADTIIDVTSRLIPFIPFDAGVFHHLLRKSAHFIAYLILGGLVMHAMRLPTGKGAVYTLVICIGYAISDEVHQLFIPGRSGEIKDVVIDGAGASTGIGLYMLSVFIIRRLTKKKCKNSYTKKHRPS